MQKACATIAITQVDDLDMQLIVNIKKKRIMQKDYVNTAILIAIAKQKNRRKFEI